MCAVVERPAAETSARGVDTWYALGEWRLLRRRSRLLKAARCRQRRSIDDHATHGYYPERVRRRNSMSQRISHKALLTAVCFALTASYPRAEELPQVFEIPAESNHRRMMVSAKVNRSKTVTLLLDTGYTIPTLHSPIIESLDVKPSGSVGIIGIAGEERAPTYRGIVFSLGGATYAPRRVAGVSPKRNQSRRRDGVLDAGFFRQFVVEFDPRGKVVRLHSPQHFRYSGSGEVLRCRFNGGVPVVTASVSVGDKPPIEGEFEIDTGCDSGLCVGSSFVERHALLSQTKAESDQKFGIGGAVQTKSGSVALLRLGKVEISDAQADFFVNGSPVDEPLAGHIGMGVLHAFKVIFNYSRAEIIIER